MKDLETPKRAMRKRVMSPVWCLTTVGQGKKVLSCLAFHLAFSGRLTHCSWESNWPDCFWCTHLTSCYIGHCRTVHLVLRNKKAVPKSPQKWIQSLLSWSLTTWKGFDGSWLGIFCSVTLLCRDHVSLSFFKWADHCFFPPDCCRSGEVSRCVHSDQPSRGIRLIFNLDDLVKLRLFPC